MRMWMIDPRLLCKSHLLGEHFELHKFYHRFENRLSMDGYLTRKLIQPELMQLRHDQLANEMTYRGYNHASPYTQPDLSYLSPEQRATQVGIAESHRILVDRCIYCVNQRKKINNVRHY